MIKKILLLLCLFFSLSGPTAADDDWQYWNVYMVKYKAGENITLLLNPELRMRDDISELSFWRSRQGIVYRINDHISIGQNYLYARRKNAAGKWSTEQGFESDLMAKWKWEKLTFSNRVRLEHRDIEFETKYRYRNRVKISKKIQILGQTITLYVFDEGFYDEEVNQFNQNRAALGFVKRINDSTSLDIGWWYRADRSAGGDWKGTNIIRTNLAFSF